MKNNFKFQIGNMVTVQNFTFLYRGDLEFVKEHVSDNKYDCFDGSKTINGKQYCIIARDYRNWTKDDKNKKYIIQDKDTKQIYVADENGLTLA